MDGLLDSLDSLDGLGSLDGLDPMDDGKVVNKEVINSGGPLL